LAVPAYDAGRIGLAKAQQMDVAGIGVQTITPTTGTSQNPNQAPERPATRPNAERVDPPPRPGTGEIVDKTA